MDSGSHTAVYSQGSAFNITLTNSIVYGGFGNGIYLDSGANAVLYNNTITGCDLGFRAENGTELLKNNIFFNNLDDFFGTFTILNYNASDDLDGDNVIDISPRAVESDGWHAAFVDYLNNDFRVRDIASVLYDSGVDPESGSGMTISIVDDIAGNPRPYHDGYDVGAFEFSSAKPEYRINGNVKFKGNIMFK